MKTQRHRICLNSQAQSMAEPVRGKARIIDWYQIWRSLEKQSQINIINPVNEEKPLKFWEKGKWNVRLMSRQCAKVMPKAGNFGDCPPFSSWGCSSEPQNNNKKDLSDCFLHFHKGYVTSTSPIKMPRKEVNAGLCGLRALGFCFSSRMLVVKGWQKERTDVKDIVNRIW